MINKDTAQDFCGEWGWGLGGNLVEPEERKWNRGGRNEIKKANFQKLGNLKKMVSLAVCAKP